MWEYWMYFPFFILHDWGKRSAEACSSHCAVLPYKNKVVRYDSFVLDRICTVLNCHIEDIITFYQT